MYALNFYCLTPVPTQVKLLWLNAILILNFELFNNRICKELINFCFAANEKKIKKPLQNEEAMNSFIK